MVAVEDAHTHSNWNIYRVKINVCEEVKTYEVALLVETEAFQEGWIVDQESHYETVY